MHLVDEIGKAFDATASQYDAQRKFIIPDLGGFYGAAIWAAECPDVPTVLDIGAGTGLLSDLILQRYPRAMITLLDISEKMLEVAERRFSGKNNVRYLIADYRKESLGGRYDLICSALSIHHLSHEEKKELFERVFDGLNLGGMFINADQAKGESEWMHRLNMQYWDEFVFRGGLPQEEAEAVLARRDTYDRMAKLSTQLEWLRGAGFSDIDVVYKNRPFVVYLGRKKS
ncbi:MAG: class I SAM-dependent methyltransferase [Methanomicrobiales archaeon]|nr:class I SAM-dependent methyltransferase [Methanomicrobiales archaeon]